MKYQNLLKFVVIAIVSAVVISYAFSGHSIVVNAAASGGNYVSVGSTQVSCLINHTSQGYLVETGTTSKYYSSANTAIDAGLATLTAGRTRNQIIALRGTFQLTRTITLPSYTTIDMYGATLKTAASYSTTFTAAHKTSVILRGGTILGNKHIADGVSFVGVDNFIVQDLKISYTWSHSAYFCNSTNGLVLRVEASHAELIDSTGHPVGQDGFTVTKVCNNITFDSVYVHDIWDPHAARPNYDMWGGGIEMMTYPGAEPKYISIVNSRFIHLGEFGVGVSTHGTGLHLYNIKVNNNTFQDIGKEAVDACYMVNAQIANNSISHTERYGINIFAAGSSSTNVYVGSNIITDAGYLTGYTHAGITTGGNGPMYSIKIIGNVLKDRVGLLITPKALSVTVDGNNFNTCGTDVTNYSNGVTWGTNINNHDQAVTGTRP